MNERIRYKDMIKNKVIDEWLDVEEVNNEEKEDDEVLGDYDFAKYEEE